jgi:hypothetical protein
MSVFSGGTSRDWTKRNEDVFCDFGMTYVSSCLPHNQPAPHVALDEGGSLEGRGQLCLL